MNLNSAATHHWWLHIISLWGFGKPHEARAYDLCFYQKRLCSPQFEASKYQQSIKTINICIVIVSIGPFGVQQRVHSQCVSLPSYKRHQYSNMMEATLLMKRGKESRVGTIILLPLDIKGIISVRGYKYIHVDIGIKSSDDFIIRKQRLTVSSLYRMYTADNCCFMNLIPMWSLRKTCLQLLSLLLCQCLAYLKVLLANDRDIMLMMLVWIWQYHSALKRLF